MAVARRPKRRKRRSPHARKLPRRFGKPARAGQDNPPWITRSCGLNRTTAPGCTPGLSLNMLTAALSQLVGPSGLDRICLRRSAAARLCGRRLSPGIVQPFGHERTSPQAPRATPGHLPKLIVDIATAGTGNSRYGLGFDRLPFLVGEAQQYAQAGDARR